MRDHRAQTVSWALCLAASWWREVEWRSRAGAAGVCFPALSRRLRVDVRERLTLQRERPPRGRAATVLTAGV